jgi:hypothetical protein
MTAGARSAVPLILGKTSVIVSWYIRLQARIPVICKFCLLVPIMTLRFYYSFFGGTPTTDVAQCIYTDLQVWNYE